MEHRVTRSTKRSFNGSRGVMPDGSPHFTPVNLITGFLGSGKTTLLQRLLASPALHNTAVLINEFGEVGLDHHLLERIDDHLILLQSGCLCCTIRGELADAIRDLHDRRERQAIPHYRRVVVESTGLADPFPVLTTVHADPVLRHHYRLGNVITTVDAVNGTGQLALQPESVKQVAAADRIVLTKTDLADEGSVRAITSELLRLNPAALIVRTTDDLNADLILAQDAFSLSLRSETARAWFSAALTETLHRGHAHNVNRHGPDIRAHVISLGCALDWASFGIWLTMLLHAHGDAILRVKGIINVSGSEAPVAVHGVQYLVHPPVHMRGWPDRDRRSRIVFITKGLDPLRIERSFHAFMATESVAV